VLSAATLNPIQVENALPGTTSWQLEVLSLHGEIQGYASSPSVQPGQTISFYVSTKSAKFDADIYRMGWYRGKGARLIMKIPWMPGHLRRVPKPDRTTGLLACGWPKSFQITVPSSWVSGIYLVKLTGSSTHQAYIPFTVTDPTSHSTYLFIHAVFTDEAYNSWGGKSLYVDINVHGALRQYNNRAVMVSFQRPFEQSQGAGWFLSWELHMVRWIESKGYDVSYATDLDVAESPQILLQHKAILIVGHDEYWTRSIRNGMDAAVAHGVNLANFAADTGYWQVRLEPLGNEPDQVIVCYKTSPDPIAKTNRSLVTTEWRLPPVSRPESELTGAMYGGFDGTHPPYAWVVADASDWIFKGSGLKNGSRIPEIVGQEADTIIHRYPVPQGLAVLASSRFHDVGGINFKAKATIYQAPSGAWVFNAGTIEWSWGLDDFVEPNADWLYPAYPKHPSPAAETITSNVLNRFAN